MVLGKLTGLPGLPSATAQEHCHSGDKCRSQAQHHGSRNTATCRSQFLLRARMFSCSRFSFHTRAHLFFPPTYWLAFPVLSPHPGCGLQEGKVCVRGGTGPHASSSWVSSQVFSFLQGHVLPPCQHRRLQLSGVWGLQQLTQRFLRHHRCREPEAGPPTCCLTCFWPAWWPTWSLSGWVRPWTSSRSGCRCKQSHFRKVRSLGGRPGVWAPVTLSWLPSSGIWLISFLWSRAAMSNHFY